MIYSQIQAILSLDWRGQTLSKIHKQPGITRGAKRQLAGRPAKGQSAAKLLAVDFYYNDFRIQPTSALR